MLIAVARPYSAETHEQRQRNLEIKLMTKKLIVNELQKDSTGNYVERNYEVDLKEAFLLLEKLKSSNTSLHFKSEFFVIDFQYLSETSFEVEIYDIRDGFWAISEIGVVVARKIVEMISADKKFGEHVPTTNDLWGAYGGGEFT